MNKRAEEIKRLFASLDTDGIIAMRSEIFNEIASEARNNKDDLPIYLMSLAELCTKQNIPAASSLFSTLLVFGRYKENRDVLEMVCGKLLHTMLPLIEDLDQLSREMILEQGL